MLNELGVLRNGKIRMRLNITYMCAYVWARVCVWVCVDGITCVDACINAWIESFVNSLVDVKRILCSKTYETVNKHISKL